MVDDYVSLMVSSIRLVSGKGERAHVLRSFFCVTMHHSVRIRAKDEGF